MSNLYTRLLTFLALRRGEVARTFLAFIYLFLVICAYLLIKAIRNSLFISEFGALKLPYVMLGIAVLAGMFAAVYIRLARRVSLPTLLVGSLLFFSSNVVLFWWMALAGRTWLFPVIYLWSGVFGVIAPTQVWTLANELFTTRESKRVFGVIGSGGILGAVVGGEVAGRLAKVVGTTNLMLIVAGFLALAAVTAGVLCRFRLSEREIVAESFRPRNLTQSLGVIGRTRHLRLLAGLVFITAVATTSVDFQFNLMAERVFQTKDELTAFFGAVYGRISLVAFLLQLLLTSRIMSRIGVPFSILLLPTLLLFGTATLLATGALWAAILLKGGDGTLKHSLDRSCRELMYLPLPARIKMQAKSTIDTVMDRMGDGSAGALQLMITTVLGLGLVGSLLANLVALGIWIALAFKIKSEYINQLREALGKKSPTFFSGPALDIEAATKQTLEQMLLEGSESERLGALEWTVTHSAAIDEELVLRIARDDPSPGVRRSALAVVLGRHETNADSETLDGLEGEEVHAALISAIDVLVEPDPARVRQRLEELIGEAGEATRLSLVAFVLRRLGPDFAPFARRILDALLAPEADAAGRVTAVRSLALLPPDSPLLDCLAGLLDDPDSSVAGAAAETAGRLRRPELLPRLIAAMGRPRLRASARRGLTLFGDAAADALIAGLDDDTLHLQARRHLPELLGRAGGRRATRRLVAGLQDPVFTIRDRCAEALYRMRQRCPTLKPLDTRQLHDCLLVQIGNFDALRAVEDLLRTELSPTDSASSWLFEILESERTRVLRYIFKLLAMEYPFIDIHRAWLAVRDGAPVRRANGVELLDNVLGKRLRKGLLPLLERAMKASQGRKSAGSRNEAFRQLAEWPNPWVAACALNAARKLGVPGLVDVARRAETSPHRPLREEAAALLAASAQAGRT